MMTLAFAFATAIATPVVHVENEIGTRVFVERIGAEHQTIVCEAPCNAPLDARYAYRLRSEAFRATNGFHQMAGVAFGLAIPSITLSVATGIPGVALLAKSTESHATPVTVPIFTKTF